MNITLASAIALWSFFGSLQASDSRRRRIVSGCTDNHSEDPRILPFRKDGPSESSESTPGFLELTLGLIAVVALVVYIIGPYLPDTTMHFGP